MAEDPCGRGAGDVVLAARPAELAHHPLSVVAAARRVRLLLRERRGARALIPVRISCGVVPAH
ncbi:hypothetical protein OTB20_41975 [Streptomyces sp. H27-H1]|uniref:hypothetical protein n=1 Tax=Streptomyces sp. H27-H1 TaxID=2996461 RepID=UPI00226EB154|nr:hypothetical protein [Streptomyces sp. H27-H1]MCY0932571.1 hypothetical protein [Streptomyces sp. H27-H1]